MTSPAVGPNSTLEFLVVADLGHYQVDGSFEYDYEESADVLNYQATGHLIDAEDPMTVRFNLRTTLIRIIRPYYAWLTAESRDSLPWDTRWRPY